MVENKAKKSKRNTMGDQFENAIVARFGGRLTAPNSEGRDWISPNGKVYELKSLRGNMPSIGGPKVIATERNLRKAITDYMANADGLVVEQRDGSIVWYETKEAAIDYLFEHCALGSASRKGGLKLRMRIGTRTAEATAKLLAAGFTL